MQGAVAGPAGASRAIHEPGLEELRGVASRHGAGIVTAPVNELADVVKRYRAAPRRVERPQPLQGWGRRLGEP